MWGVKWPEYVWCNVKNVPDLGFGVGLDPTLLLLLPALGAGRGSFGRFAEEEEEDGPEEALDEIVVEEVVDGGGGGQ